ncbi:hypothetical protein BD410DRAFT_137869 [Rickenella mellea]|uniref:Secreted protein n=1 Tax=Rickenella mellea TaxID=50990 RepID=A0A4Y7PIB2_9AGAM|nr:hypothetical protein BD410DRAFT_137869 [Rickenella mellea]
MSLALTLWRLSLLTSTLQRLSNFVCQIIVASAIRTPCCGSNHARSGKWYPDHTVVLILRSYNSRENTISCAAELFWKYAWLSYINLSTSSGMRPWWKCFCSAATAAPKSSTQISNVAVCQGERLLRCKEWCHVSHNGFPPLSPWRTTSGYRAHSQFPTVSGKERSAHKY